MNPRRLCVLFVFFLVLTVGFLNPGHARAEMAVGQEVMANWTGDAFWYHAVIVGTAGADYRVIFFDLYRETLPTSRLKPETIKVGDKIFGNWKGKGTYYPGKITVRQGHMIHILYEDGGEEDTTISHIRLK